MLTRKRKVGEKWEVGDPAGLTLEEILRQGWVVRLETTDGREMVYTANDDVVEKLLDRKKTVKSMFQMFNERFGKSWTMDQVWPHPEKVGP